MPKGVPALEASSAAVATSESQVHVLSSGTCIPAFAKTFGSANSVRQLIPALMPTSLPLILPASTVPSRNLDVSTPLRSRSAPLVP